MVNEEHPNISEDEMRMWFDKGDKNQDGQLLRKEFNKLA
jgi:hypothetical protein